MLVNENLTKGSYRNKNSKIYRFDTIALKEDLIKGQEYTLTLYGDFKDIKRIALYNLGGTKVILSMNVEDPKKIKGSFVFEGFGDKDETSRYDFLSLYKFPKEDETSVYIEKYKLEKGNQSTEYIPNEDLISVENQRFIIGEGNYSPIKSI